jgi:agmatine deiminase
MPVEIAPRQFVQFRYWPSYVVKYPSKLRYISNGSAVFEKLMPGEKVQVSSIALDGGNLLLNATHALMTDRLFTENPDISPAHLLSELEHILQRRIVILPAQDNDEIGHVDGMVRFLSDGSVLMNEYKDAERQIGDRLRAILEKEGLDVHTLTYHPDDNPTDLDATGIYINYLRAGDCLFVPAFGGVLEEKDAAALATLSGLHPGCRMFPVNCSDIAKLGGLLHCVSWTRYGSDSR